MPSTARDIMNSRRPFIKASELTNTSTDFKDIVLPKRGTEDQRKFAQLFKDCFEHHITTLNDKSKTKIEILIDDPKRYVALDLIALKFRTEHLADFRIAATRNSNIKDFEDNTVTFEELAREVTAHPLHSSNTRQHTGTPTNRICFLIGNVGRGKSLLVSKIIERNRHNPSKATTWRALPIYFDCEQLWRGEDGKLRNVDNDFFDKIYDQLLTTINKEELTQETDISGYLTQHPQPKDNRAPKTKLLSLSKHLRQKGFYIFLALDNTDRFHFGFTKYAFFEQFSYEQERSIERNLMHLVRTLNNNEELGTLGAAVLIVCRRHVFDHFAKLNDGCDPNSLCLSDYTVFSIKSAPANTVIKKRLELFQNLATIVASSSTIPDETKEQIISGTKLLHDSIAAVASEQESADKVLELINLLCHQGLRSFIAFGSSLSLDFRDNCELIRRIFVTQTHHLLRLYITNSHQRYSEEAGHFPNLYLNDAMHDISPQFKEAHKPHPHTYWLRYLILSTLDSAPGSRMRFEDLRDLFVNKGDYSDPLFRLTVGQLSMPEKAGLIKVEFSKSGPSDHLLSPTERGKALIGTQRQGLLYGVPLCFSFHYLQLITDDPRLQHPEPWATQLIVNQSLWYTLKPSEEFNRHAIVYLEAKMPACLLFFKILATSFAAEKLNHPALFNNSDHPNPTTPDFAKLETELMNAFSAILTHFPKDRAERLLFKLKSDQSTLSTSTDIEKHFFEHYQTNTSNQEQS